MLKTLTCLFSTLIILSIPTIASACLVYHPPQELVNGSFDAIVIGTVTQSKFVGNLAAERPAWQASAKKSQIVSRKTHKANFVFGREGSENSCDDGQRIAKVGDTWALYLRKHPDTGILTVYESYPLSLARKIDRRFTGQPSAKP